MSTMIMIILAAGAGSLMRWGMAHGPWGLILVNALGSTLAGWVAGAAGGKFDSYWSTVILVGFCGGLTTFSGYAVSQVRFLEQGEIFKFGLHFILNNAMCLVLCYWGWRFAHKT